MTYPLEEYTEEMYAEAETRALRGQIDILKEILSAAPDALTMGMQLDTESSPPRYFSPIDRCPHCNGELRREANWYRSL